MLTVTVSMFWHGAPLTRVERLSISSFLAHGHPVDLYVYDEPGGVPAGARLRDAGAILPREAVFAHRRTGSLAPFADRFRYTLLAAHEGLWVDTDMVCLQPLDYPQAEIFGWENAAQLNNAVLGLPAGHPLAAWLAAASAEPNRAQPYDDLRTRWRKAWRRHFGGDRPGEVRWGETGPKALTSAARHFGLLDRALPPNHFYPVAANEWRRLFESPEIPWPPDSRAVHLWNNMAARTAGFDKNARFAAGSPFETLCRRHGID
jgi:hypothetical protein